MKAWLSTPTTQFFVSLRRWLVVLCTWKSFMPFLLPCAFYSFYGASYNSSPLTVGCCVFMHSLWHASVTSLSSVSSDSICIFSESWASRILTTINLSTDSCRHLLKFAHSCIVLTYCKIINKLFLHCLVFVAVFLGQSKTLKYIISLRTHGVDLYIVFTWLCSDLDATSDTLH